MSGSAFSSVHPDRVRAALGGPLSDATVARLLASGRLRDRLEARLGIGDDPGAEFAWLIADPDAAARGLGAALHGRSLRAVVAGPAVAALVAAIGPDAHAFGLRNGTLCPPREGGGGDGGDDLVGAILHDGYAGLGAWLAGAPEPVRRAVLLALPSGTRAEAETFDPKLAEQAAPILALLAREIENAGGEAYV